MAVGGTEVGKFVKFSPNPLFLPSSAISNTRRDGGGDGESMRGGGKTHALQMIEFTHKGLLGGFQLHGTGLVRFRGRQMTEKGFK